MRIRKAGLLVCFMLVVMLAGCAAETGENTPHPEDIHTEEKTGTDTAGGQELETAGTGRTSEMKAAEAAGTDSTSEAHAAETAGTGHTSEVRAAEYATASRGCIVIDPGHQQYANMEQEPVGPGAAQTKNKVAGGTSGIATGVPEYQLTLDIGLLLRDELEKRGYTVIMIRETNDVDISNAERAEVANEAEADAFVRLHGNGVDNHSVSGAMAICQTPGNPYNGDLYEASRKLSDCILEAYTQKTGIAYERVWETDTMSGINWCTVPVTILEMGYMTNSEEDMKMQDPETQELMAEGIADGIDAFMAHKAPEVD